MNDLNFDEDPESLSFLGQLKKEADGRSLSPDDDIIPLEIVPVVCLTNLYCIRAMETDLHVF